MNNTKKGYPVRACVCICVFLEKTTLTDTHTRYRETETECVRMAGPLTIPSSA